ncbi:MAG TPA: PBP1A family penicillin-binding protein [Gaiellaceae bacterium]|nr:PBP1A family penicillin-binding protein [Gaiellaceae bacterium]
MAGQIVTHRGARLPPVLALFRRKPRRPKRRRIRKLRLLALLLILGLLGFSAFALGLLTSISQKLPALDPAKQQHDTQANTYVYANDGHTILAILRGSQARIVVPDTAISPWMKHAIVAIEDKRFYEHRGVDLRGMARAVWADVTNHGTVQGGSTITQQFVKNAYLTSQKTIGRKLVEAALAWQLEQKWKKDRILSAYLNTVYFGNQAYGVEQACRIYFHHSASHMQPAEAALLAGIPEDPSLYDPVAHPAAAKARRNLVLFQLWQQHYLTRGQYRASLRVKMPDPHGVSLPSSVSAQAPYFANYVRDQLVQQFGSRKAFSGGLHVKTTIDLGLQKIARDAAQSVLPNPDGPADALVAIRADGPEAGAVVAMVGGRNYHQSQFNLATQGERQPGSAFKPFVLASALEQHIAPSSVFQSKPVTINADGKLWPVNNYEGEYLGPITLATGIAVSDNAVYSQLTALVGPKNVAKTARALGITTPLQGYFSIGLGGEWTTPLDLARAYASFADGGRRIDGSMFGDVPRAVECLSDTKGNCKSDNAPKYHEVLTPEQDEVLNQLLQGVVTSGTGKAAALPGWQVAGKTGTTSNYGDAWFCGYVPQLVTCVWVGYPTKEQSMFTEFHGRPVAGGTYPALIWKAFMSKALPYLQDQPEAFAAPPYLSASPALVVNRNGLLERDNGLCKNVYDVNFYGGQAPARLASCKKDEVEVPDVVGETLTAARQRLEGQPLTPAYVFKPAKTGQRLNIVLSQFPKAGTLSAYDKVHLVVPKSLHGAIPRVIGNSVARARRRLKKLHVRITIVGPVKGKVTGQSPRADTASAPGLRVTLRTSG